MSLTEYFINGEKDGMRTFYKKEWSTPEGIKEEVRRLNEVDDGIVYSYIRVGVPNAEYEYVDGVKP